MVKFALLSVYREIAILSEYVPCCGGTSSTGANNGILNDMEKHQESSRPTELRIQVSGDTVEHLFVNAADALADILSPNRYANIASTEHIRVESADRDAALVDFLNALLTRSHAEHSVFIPGSVTLSSAQEKIMVEAVMRRYIVPALKQDIRAVAQQELHIVQTQGAWQTPVTFNL